MKRFAILTSGGDAPGMNAAIRAATLVGVSGGAEVIGIQHGYQGLLDGELTPLGPGDVVDIIRDGGTILGSARCPDFHDPKARVEARARLAGADVEGLLVVGGNGSLTGLEALTAPSENDSGLLGVGIPASIDNDVGSTRLSIGVDTAVNTIVEACDKIMDTATAHDRTFIVEVMGRACGYLAMASGIASAANVVLFPEMGRTPDEVIETVVRAVLGAQRRGRHRSKRVLVIKAEGVDVPLDHLRTQVEARLKEELGDVRATDTRVTVLGHVVRGGRPSALDRQIASRLANVGVKTLAAGRTRLVACWKPPKRPEDATPADPQCSTIDLSVVLEETRAMLGGSSGFVRWRRQAFQDIENMLAI